MAVSSICFQSQILNQPVSLSLMLPDTSPIKSVLYLLHGYSDGHNSFIYNSALARYCGGIPLAVIMPEAHCSFYMDTAYGRLYWQHISEEVPKVLQQWFKLDISRTNSFIGGISMGGYGAAKLAMQKPNKFSRAFLFSPVTDIVGISKRGLIDDKDSGVPRFNKLHFDSILGNRRIANTSDDLFFLIEHECIEKFPEFTIYTGTEDFMYKDILYFKQVLTKKGVECSLQTSLGNHCWKTWEPFLRDMVASIAKCK